jgi:hypothetical protein
MGYRAAPTSLHGVFFLCTALLLLCLGLFALPAAAQEGPGSGPPAGTPAPGRDTNDDTTLDIATIAANDCRVSPGASVTLSDYDGTRARFVDGRLNINITATENQLTIQGPPDESLEQNAVKKFPDTSFFNDGDWTVVSTTGITCRGGGSAADQQYDDGGTTPTADDDGTIPTGEDDIIAETIPQKKLPNTGGVHLGGALWLAAFVAVASVLLIRRT